MKSFSKLLAVVALLFSGLNQATAQSPSKADQATKAAEVSDLIAGGRYTFVATKLVSPKGGSRPLEAGYVLDVSKDTLIAHLPGYDRPELSATGDSSLTLTHFGYQVTPAKNGGQVITMRPAAESAPAMGKIKLIKLTVSSLGYGTLAVTGAKRQVTCYGYIKPHSAEFPPVNAQH